MSTSLLSRMSCFVTITVVLIFVDLFTLSLAAILRTGSPLPWKSSKSSLPIVRDGGLEQFIRHYKRCVGLESNMFLWGDEMEYGIFRKNKDHYDIAIGTGTRLREELNAKEAKLRDLPIGCEWQPEYGSWMIEAVPRNPYGSFVSDLINVEKSMQLRRKRLHKELQENEIAPSVSNFPMLGVKGRGYQHCEESHLRGVVANSAYISDSVINPHVRFGTLTQNIRERKGSNVNITVPLDSQITACEDLINDNGNCSSNFVHMDAMAFGMGCCCLQVTMQCKTEKESRYLHDQLAVISPLLQALSAATPIFRGQFVNTDTRWDVISQAVDDRNIVESGIDESKEAIETCRDEFLVGQGIRKLHKSRYSSVSMYINTPETEIEMKALNSLNDVDANIDEDSLDKLQKEGIDPILAQHIAHLFVRDPLVIFNDAIELENDKHLDHFENIQSTNWRSMRWKMPSLPSGLEYHRRKQVGSLKEQQKNQVDISIEKRKVEPFEPQTSHMRSGAIDGNSNILMEDKYADQYISKTDSKTDDDLQNYGPGWRVEFRPLELQLTDFENAAYSMFIVLLSRALLSESFSSTCPVDFDLYMPISYVEENMRRAQLKDAALTQKFYVRRMPQKKMIDKSEGFKKRASDCCDLEQQVTDKYQSTLCSIPNIDDIEVVELSLDEIVNGQKKSEDTVYKDSNLFPGLIPLTLQYVKTLGCDDFNDVASRLEPFLNLLSRRAAGELPTTARWIRNYVTMHPDYANHNKITNKITDDLLSLCEDMGMGRVPADDLIGSDYSIPNLDIIAEEDLFYSNFTCYRNDSSGNNEEKQNDGHKKKAMWQVKDSDSKDILRREVYF